VIRFGLFGLGGLSEGGIFIEEIALSEGVSVVIFERNNKKAGSGLLGHRLLVFKRRVEANCRSRFVFKGLLLLVFKGLLLHKIVDFFEALSEIAHKSLQTLHTRLISATFVQTLLQRLNIIQFSTLELGVLKDKRD